MNGEQIGNILCMDPFVKQNLIGFGTPDIPIVPNKHGKNSLFIFNTDKSTGPGQHWCAGYFLGKNNLCEFFDPFGFPPSIYKLDKPIFHHVPKIIFNNQTLQPIDSNTCGYYCIYYAMMRCRGMSMPEIVSTFSNSDLNKNDDIVTKVVLQFGKSYKI